MLISVSSDVAWADIVCVTGLFLKDAGQWSSVSSTFKNKLSTNTS